MSSYSGPIFLLRYETTTTDSARDPTQLFYDSADPGTGRILGVVISLLEFSHKDETKTVQTKPHCTVYINQFERVDKQEHCVELPEREIKA